MSRRSLIKLTTFLLQKKNPFSRRSVSCNSPSSHYDFRRHHHLQIPYLKSPSDSIINFEKAAAAANLRRRLYSSESTNESDPKSTPNPNPNPSPKPDMKHQEIEGPTVEKDLSPLANETREVTHSLLKTMYNVSRLLALLGLAHLAIGAYCYASASSAATAAASALALMAFGFPFSMAFMLRQSLKSMHFFQKMENIGRLQILTSSMQISKQLRIFFLRLSAISYLCLAGLSLSLIYSVSSSL
ncbi:hypothetical protein SOVF_198330 [Spinacia oleracea]|uniref:Transmembrane protein n=1 Tax=Spinacia oleracea TaxID=3562 RepID=A0A9R0J418_SPIOL|nr:uncharacterized protein LOC110800012 [Spinacia oleracea]KNA04583.1 hypothetical protein SOVF_198330 [Spinacia oleracea]